MRAGRGTLIDTWVCGVVNKMWEALLGVLGQPFESDFRDQSRLGILGSLNADTACPHLGVRGALDAAMSAARTTGVGPVPSTYG
jgi:hypothetical protein